MGIERQQLSMVFTDMGIAEDNFIPRNKKNVMELLVAEEINKQIENYPPQLREYINLVEVSTYALNRLPPLYASSEEGLYRQKQRGQKEYKNQISDVVREALEVIQKEPLRFSTPLSEEEAIDLQEAEETLQALKLTIDPK